MIETRPYSYIDALVLEPKEEGIKDQVGYETWAKLNELGPGYTIVMDDEIIACAGIRLFPGYKTAGEAWIILSKEKSDQHIKYILKEFGKRLEYVIKEMKIRWIQIALKKDNEKGIRFAQHFKFERKCSMAGYLPDSSDALLYAREIKL